MEIFESHFIIILAYQNLITKFQLMRNSLIILSNTNVRFQEPEEIIEGFLERLNKFPWDWKFIYETCFPEFRKFLNNNPNPQWQIFPWRPDPLDEWNIGTWDNIKGCLDFYVEPDTFSINLLRYAAELHPCIGMGRYYIFDSIKQHSHMLKGFNQERKIYKHLSQALGGDRVIYLGDQIKEHEKYLDLFWANQTPFEEIEALMLKDLGPPEKTMLTIYNDESYHNARYFIDRFEDLR
jgi:hypothetical protein